MGKSHQERYWFDRAAPLHDVGKLNETEWAKLRPRASCSEELRSHIFALAEPARMGGAHHERLNAKDCPRALTGADISFATRIVTTANDSDAFTAGRPYGAAPP